VERERSCDEEGDRRESKSVGEREGKMNKKKGKMKKNKNKKKKKRGVTAVAKLATSCCIHEGH